jgi:hypothetical protein
MHLDRSRINLIIGGMIIIVLFLTVIFAVRPGDFFRRTRNATRQNHIRILITAVYSYATDHNGLFPECLPDPGQPAVNINECLEELKPYLMHLVLLDPDPKYSYMIEFASGGTERELRIFSTAPEAKNIEIVR